MNSKNQKLKSDPIEARINRIRGQIKGVKRMYRKDPCDCVGIVNQIQAARAALGSLAEKILLDEAKRCVDKGDIEEFEKIINKTFKTI